MPTEAELKAKNERLRKALKKLYEWGNYYEFPSDMWQDFYVIVNEALEGDKK